MLEGYGMDFLCRSNMAPDSTMENNSILFVERTIFILTEITVNYHDQADPANTGKTVRKSITPNVPLEDFTITDYMKE